MSIAPDSNTMTSLSSVKHGICPNGCGFSAKSPISKSKPSSYKAQSTKGDREPGDPYNVKPMASDVSRCDAMEAARTAVGLKTKADEADIRQERTTIQ